MNKGIIIANKGEIINKIKNKIKSTIEIIKKIPDDIKNDKNIKNLFFKLIKWSKEDITKKDITRIKNLIKNSKDIKNLVCILKKETGNCQKIKGLFDNINDLFDDFDKLRAESEEQIEEINKLFDDFKDWIEITKEYTQKTELMINEIVIEGDKIGIKNTTEINELLDNSKDLIKVTEEIQSKKVNPVGRFFDSLKKQVSKKFSYKKNQIYCLGHLPKGETLYIAPRRLFEKKSPLLENGQDKKGLSTDLITIKNEENDFRRFINKLRCGLSRRTEYMM